MPRSLFDSGGTDKEAIELLTTISQVSARLARNMAILADQRQSMKGENSHEQNERNGYDHRRTAQCSRCY